MSEQGEAIFAEDGYVFVPDAQHCYLPAKVWKTFRPGEEGLISYLPLNGGDITDESKVRKIKVPASETQGYISMDIQSISSLSNMVDLKQLNDASLLHNLRMRFLRDEIYTQIGSILVSVNPFKVLSIYTPQMMEKYLREGARLNPPHIFGVADNAYRQMIQRNESQSCIVSGESGAGKTEATKLFLSYIAEASSQGDDVTGAGSIQQQVLEANPLMEAFGNSKTTRNDNSSRFGKWIAVKFNNKRGNIIGGSITQYLLEKTRVVSHGEGERNYHIFYQLSAACLMDPKLAALYKVKNPESYHYLNHNPVEVFTVTGTDDYKEFEYTMKAMEVIGIGEEQRVDVLRTVAGILHLGNIKFDKIEQPGKDARAGIANVDHLHLVCTQLGTSVEVLTKALTKKNVSVGKEVVFSEYSVDAACNARDALAKALFGKLFEWLTFQINASLASGASLSGKSVSANDTTVIGVLDIFGFESFETNSFEQLCINYCNEKLQGFFNDHIFKQEQIEYESEGIDVKKVGFSDNQVVLDALETKPNGIFALMDEEMITPRGSDEGFLKKLVGSTGKSLAAVPISSALSRVSRTDSTNLRANSSSNLNSSSSSSSSTLFSDVIKRPDVRLIREKPSLAQSFIIVHFAGEVAYNTSGFLSKNKDALIEDLEKVALESSIRFIQELFTQSQLLQAGNLDDDPSESIRSRSRSQSYGGGAPRKTVVASGKYSLGAQFKDQLSGLMKALRATDPHFVRCVKSNPEKKGNVFAAKMVLDQLRYSGLMEVTRIRKLGYPIRKVFDEFIERYYVLCPGFTKKSATIPELLKGLEKLNLLPENEWQKGKAKVFMRLPTHYGLEIARDLRLGESATKIGKIGRGFLARFRFKRYRQILDEIAVAMIKNDEARLDSALLSAGELPHNGRHLPVIDEARAVLDKLQEERKVLELVQDAIDERDMAFLESSIAAANELGLSKNKMVLSAMTLLDVLRKERAVRDLIREAIEHPDIEGLSIAILQAEKSGLGGLPETKVAISLRDRILAEKKGIEELTRAIKSNDISGMLKWSESLVNLGLGNNPLIAEAEVITKRHAEESAERAKEIAKVEHELHDAVRAHDLEALNRLHPSVIRLGLEGPTVKMALTLRDRMTFEIEAFEQIDAEMKTVRVKAGSYHGITRHDLAPLTKALTKVKAKGLDSHPKVDAAIEFQTRMIKQLVVQEQLKQALREKKLDDLVKAAEKATALGMQTNVAKRVFAEVRNSQKRKIAMRPRKRRSIDTGANPQMLKALQAESQRDQLNRLCESSSQVFIEKLSKATNEIYEWKNYFEIRGDDDYTQFEIQSLKKQKAEMKLKFQKTPITRSLLAFDVHKNRTAIQIHRSLLGWCGDANTSFAAPLAQDIIMSGLETPELVDEIYIQCFKHANENPRKESNEQLWLLLSLITKHFAPSPNFELYALNFFIQFRNIPGLIGNFARLSIRQLDAVLETGSSPYSPSLEDIQRYQLRPPVLASVHAVDGSVCDIPIYPEMTITHTIEILARLQKTPVDDIPKMGIFVTPRQFILREEPVDTDAFVTARAVAESTADAFQGEDRQMSEELVHTSSKLKLVEDFDMNSAAAPPPRHTVVGGGNNNQGGLLGSIVSTSNNNNNSSYSSGGDIVDAMENFRMPSAPKTPWPLPNMVYLGDIFQRMESQGREPIFSYKKKIFLSIKEDSLPDKLLYYQLVQDFVSGALPFQDEAQVVALVACSMAAKMGKVPSDPNKLIEEDLMSFVPLQWSEKKTEKQWAVSVLKVADVVAEMSASELRQRYIQNCRLNPLYGMHIFYGYVDPNEQEDIPCGINYKGIHILNTDFEITNTIPFAAIQKFGASPFFLWLHISHKKQSTSLNFYTLQAAEMFGLIHDYTHWSVQSNRARPTQVSNGHKSASSNPPPNKRTSVLATAASAIGSTIRRLSLERRPSSNLNKSQSTSPPSSS